MATTLDTAVGGLLADELASLAERVRAGVVRITNGRGAGSGCQARPCMLALTMLLHALTVFRIAQEDAASSISCFLRQGCSLFAGRSDVCDSN